MGERNSITVEAPVTLDEMTNEALTDKLDKSRQQIESGEGIPMNEVFDILEEYDFSQGIKNPYMKRR